MSVCTFIASDFPLMEVAPNHDYPNETDMIIEYNKGRTRKTACPSFVVHLTSSCCFGFLSGLRGGTGRFKLSSTEGRALLAITDSG